MKILNSLKQIFQRSITSDKIGPNRAFEIGLDWAPQASSGESVSPQTALGIVAYFAAIRNISEDIAKLPLKVYRDNGNGGRVAIPTHPLQSVLDYPNPEMTSFTFREVLTAAALAGNGYAEIVRDGAGRPQELWPLPYKDVTPKRDSNGKLFYEVRIGNNRAVRLAPSDVIHIKGLGNDGITGFILASIARQSLGLALAMDKFGGAYFGNGANPSGILRHPGHLSEAAIANLRKSLEQRYSGASNAHKVMIVEEGMDYTPQQHTPEQAQFIELRNFSIGEVARLFRLPPHKLGALDKAATYASVEMQSLEYVQDTLMSWAIRWEQEIELKLTSPRVRDVYVKHEFNSMLRGDSQARGEYYSKMFSNGIFSINQIRALEEMEPIKDGDTHFVPVNLAPLDKAINPPPPAPASPPAPSQEPADKAEEPEPEQKAEPVTEAQRMAFKALLVDSISRSLRVELARLEGGKTAADATQFRNIISAPIRAIAATYGVEAVSITQSAVEYHVEQSNNQKATELDADAWTARAYAEAERILESMKEQK